ncbi:hypothetical protein BP5796_07212 [Coleophoma crateriformis]|uniref:ELYS-like domain-containing protein n=1 Tax=Coleophoma crateriformis TaxID=565419 RepID=A0A3D8RIG8_9HELO|nr:hypothetical protein BP5796_07212 [Coleophoma crateriformis]
MYSYQSFDDVFSFDLRCAYDDQAVHDIEVCRKKLEGLFVDKVLKLMGIKRITKIYPPKTNGDLRNLHKAIVDSAGADHHKISVLYYVLLDLDAPTGRRVYSSSLESCSYMPPKYSIYMKGLWHMDRFEFDVALQYLTHPSLIPTFADEILEALVRHAKHGDLRLPLAYYHTVQPALASSSAMESLFSSIARNSVTEAFYFTRSQPEYARRHMLQILIALVVNNSSQKTIASRSMELVNLPFSAEEEEWFEKYLVEGEGRLLKKGKDTLMMRKIGTGKFSEALSVEGASGRTHGGLGWHVIAGGIQDGLGPRMEPLN